MRDVKPAPMKISDDVRLLYDDRQFTWDMYCVGVDVYHLYQIETTSLNVVAVLEFAGEDAKEQALKVLHHLFRSPTLNRIETYNNGGE